MKRGGQSSRSLQLSSLSFPFYVWYLLRPVADPGDWPRGWFHTWQISFNIIYDIILSYFIVLYYRPCFFSVSIDKTYPQLCQTLLKLKPWIRQYIGLYSIWWYVIWSSLQTAGWTIAWAILTQSFCTANSQDAASRRTAGPGSCALLARSTLWPSNTSPPLGGRCRTGTGTVVRCGKWRFFRPFSALFAFQCT